MAIEVFNRIENKFFVPWQDYPKLLDFLHHYMRPDRHNKDGKFYTICNLYYDTDDHFLISQSIQKPAYKEKLRLRTYGVPEGDSLAFIEIKKKVGKVVNKRRTAMTLSRAYEYLETGCQSRLDPEVNPQVLHEIDYFLSHYTLRPQVYIAYDRMAFFSKDHPDLRISFDFNIRTRRNHLYLEYGDAGNLLLPEDMLLMEVKAERAVPYWLARMLSDFRIYRTSFSKYGTEYKLYLQHQSTKKEMSSCLTSYFKHLRMQHLPLATR